VLYGVEWESEARVDDLIIGPGDNVCLTGSKLEISQNPVVFAHVHAERPVHPVKDYAVFGLDCRIG
jgi:hypothetical protein